MLSNGVRGGCQIRVITPLVKAALLCAAGQWAAGARHGRGMQQCPDHSSFVGSYRRAPLCPLTLPACM